MPFGTTTGERIELDGINGEIRVYDDADNLLLAISGEDGFVVYDTDGDPRAQMASPFLGAYSALLLRTSAANETQPAVVALSDLVMRDMNRLVITPGERNGKGALELTLVSQGGTTAQAALIQAICETLDGSERPYIDFTGVLASVEAARPYTVVHDLYYGTPNGAGDGPTLLGSYPRGVLERVRRTTILTCEAETTISTLPAVTLVSGRRYRLAFYCRSLNWGTAAAAAYGGIRIRDGAGGTQICDGSFLIQSALGQAAALVETVVDCPADIAAGSHTFVATLQRTAGAAGTISLFCSATSPGVLYVEDVGST